MITPTTQIAGAGVLGNDRKADESCARAAAAASGPPTRPAHNAAGVSPEIFEPPAEAMAHHGALHGDQLDAVRALGLRSGSSPRRVPNSSSISLPIWARPCMICPVLHYSQRPRPARHWRLADLILGSQGFGAAVVSTGGDRTPRQCFRTAPGADWEK